MNYSWGADALMTIHDYAVTMTFRVQALYYVIAGVRMIVPGSQIHVKMNTGEDGTTKSIITPVGTCLFLIGAFLVFLAFFGYRIQKPVTDGVPPR